MNSKNHIWCTACMITVVQYMKLGLFQRNFLWCAVQTWRTVSRRWSKKLIIIYVQNIHLITVSGCTWGRGHLRSSCDHQDG